MASMNDGQVPGPSKAAGVAQLNTGNEVQMEEIPSSISDTWNELKILRCLICKTANTKDLVFPPVPASAECFLEYCEKIRNLYRHIEGDNYSLPDDWEECEVPLCEMCHDNFVGHLYQQQMEADRLKQEVAERMNKIENLKIDMASTAQKVKARVGEEQLMEINFGTYAAENPVIMEMRQNMLTAHLEDIQKKREIEEISWKTRMASQTPVSPVTSCVSHSPAAIPPSLALSEDEPGFHEHQNNDDEQMEEGEQQHIIGQNNILDDGQFFDGLEDGSIPDNESTISSDVDIEFILADDLAVTAMDYSNVEPESAPIRNNAIAGRSQIGAMQIQQPNVNSDVVGEGASSASGGQELVAPKTENDKEQPSTSMAFRLRSTRKKFNCRTCGRAFLSMVVLRSHECRCKRPVAAAGSPSLLIPCIAVGCGLIYVDMKEMSKHLLSCHKINLIQSDRNRIQCGICKMKFVDMECFGIHQKFQRECSQTKNSSDKRTCITPVVKLER